MPHRARAIWILICLACGFTVISFNLIQIQLVQHDKYWKMAIDNHLRSEKIPAIRGSIFDSDGNLLAATQVRTDLFLDGKLLEHPETTLPQLANVLQVPPQQLLALYDPKKRNVNLASDLDDVAVAKLKALKLHCLIFQDHDRRFYPNNELGSHVLGFVDGEGHGLSGVEKEMDSSLSGVPGERLVERDARNHDIAGYQTRDTPATDGYDVTLTINTAIQHVIEDQLDQIVQTYQPNAAYIIIMDPHTGEILGMGSRPTFDPNDSKTFTPDAVRNRCITDAVEPGSIFKIITLAGALNEGQLTLDTPIFCDNGSFAYGGRILHDDEKAGFGTISAKEVFAQSSNIGTAHIAIDYLGENKLYKYARAFGIGQRTGVLTQQGESSGLFRPVNQWSAISITRVPMGQEVLATPIQMVTAMSVIANGGRLVVPQLTKQVTDREGHVMKVFQPRIVRQVISQDAADQVAEALHQVTIDGTAKNIKVPGYSIAGKTGTAQKFLNGEYSHDHHVSSFIGFMPAKDPDFVALVMVDDPKTTKYYGAEVSAPVFVELAKQMAQIRNIPQDQPESTPAAPALSSNNPTTL
jgi:cell division protein FtsI (penicillin-binding protein 3)/stage V sporulation protein D (sporulation-specific penicillin-binding protein)